ncbi:MAG: hypothetical protein JOY71_12705 [Acetobacteraceae bacterium]|nr:hypothetical protein [Acetobacteraceae bacterium]
MPDDVRLPIRLEADSSAESARADRGAAMAFVTDPQSESALREGLLDALPEGIETRRADIYAAIAALQKIPALRVLVVDISGEEQPVGALARLSEVVEPDACVLVVGESNDLGLYREITRGLGAAEYLAKPLTRDLVSRHFSPLVRGQAPARTGLRGGRFITVTGARGGVGASVIAANLAWYVGALGRRHTALLDADLYLGTAAFLLNAEAGSGLRTALEAPDRIDALLAERASRPVADRLHVLSGQENLAQQVGYAPGAGGQLVEVLRKRYNFIIGDVAWRPAPLSRDLLQLADHRVLVLTPTLASARDALRILSLNGSAGAARKQGASLVLNRLGMPGGLKRAQVEEALDMPVDVVIPDLPREIGTAATLGEPAAAQSGAFSRAIAELAGVIGSSGLPQFGKTSILARLQSLFGNRK